MYRNIVNLIQPTMLDKVKDVTSQRILLVMRQDLLINNKYYHVLTRSIAGYIVFNNEEEFSRFINLLKFYQEKRPPMSFSRFTKLSSSDQEYYLAKQILSSKDKLIEIISYCIMPTHLHLALEQLLDNGISLFMKNVLNSYAKYFNLRHKRKGPLWEGRFKNVLIKNDSQLLHLTRYHHLNPVSAELIDKPECWHYSSYNEYLGLIKPEDKICNFEKVLEIKPLSYKKFIENRISYQRQLSRIKKLMLE